MQNLEDRLTPEMESLLYNCGTVYGITVDKIRGHLRDNRYWTDLPYWVVTRIQFMGGVGEKCHPSEWFIR